jgi:hypothetical protein
MMFGVFLLPLDGVSLAFVTSSEKYEVNICNGMADVIQLHHPYFHYCRILDYCRADLEAACKTVF